MCKRLQCCDIKNCTNKSIFGIQKGEGMKGLRCGYSNHLQSLRLTGLRFILIKSTNRATCKGSREQSALLSPTLEESLGRDPWVLCACPRGWWCEVESKRNLTEPLDSRSLWLLYSCCICHWCGCRQYEKNTASMYTHYFVCSSWWIFLNERKP